MSMTEPVRTRSGPISDVPGRLPQATVFTGIPYAASTAGPNRWRLPQPVTPWRELRVIAEEFGARVVNFAATRFPTVSDFGGGRPSMPDPRRRCRPAAAGSRCRSRGPRRSASSPAPSTPNRRGSRCTYRA